MEKRKRKDLVGLEKEASGTPSQFCLPTLAPDCPWMKKKSLGAFYLIAIHTLFALVEQTSSWCTYHGGQKKKNKQSISAADTKQTLYYLASHGIHMIGIIIIIIILLYKPAFLSPHF